MQSILLRGPPEIQIKILSNLSLRQLIHVSGISKYFLGLIRGYPWNFMIDLQNEFPKSTIRHILSNYQFRGYSFLLCNDIDEVLDELNPILVTKVLKLLTCTTTGKNLYLFPHLSELNLHNCSELVDESIVTLCQNRTQPFEKIDLGFCHRSRISDISLEAISKIGCHRLILDDNNMITDVGIQKIVSSGKISVLELLFCRQITDAAFVSTNGSVELQSLDLSHCSITDLTLNKLGRCKQLSIQHCQDITDKGLLALRDCTDLSLINNPLITQQGIIALLNYGNLRKLRIHYEHLKYDSEFLEKMYPNVSIE